MKKQNKLSIKVRDLEPSKDVTGGRRHEVTVLHAYIWGFQGSARATDTDMAWAPSDFIQACITDKERAARGPIPRCGS